MTRPMCSPPRPWPRCHTCATLGSQINTRLLEAERLSQTLIVQPSLVERVQQPVLAGKQRVPALRLGDPRVLALLHAPYATSPTCRTASATATSDQWSPASSDVSSSRTPLVR